MSVSQKLQKGGEDSSDEFMIREVSQGRDEVKESHGLIKRRNKKFGDG